MGTGFIGLYTSAWHDYMPQADFPGVISAGALQHSIEVATFNIMNTPEVSQQGEFAGVLTEFRARTWHEMQEILDGITNSRMEYIYRGQANSNWPLAPSLERLTRTLMKRELSSTWDGLSPVRRAISANGQTLEYDLRATLMTKFERRITDHLRARAQLFGAGLAPDEGATFRYLADLQHHGAPTRLLDWTRSPQVATFFAVENVSTRQLRRYGY